jgi:D-sedoheptulose 7-phosphate isomerase
MNERPATPRSFEESARELTTVLGACASLDGIVHAVGEKVVECLRNGGKVLTCGNGGSAADALHLAQELVGCYERDRRALPAVCLSADATALTCIGNDYGFERIFARGVEALGKKGDVLVAFTTSGNSPNVLAALEAARRLGVVTVVLTGKNGGKARALCDHALVVPSETTARIQEVHTLILHQWLEAIDAQDWA